jgi:hypothetical protein
LNNLWKVETSPELNNDASAKSPIARELYQELAQLSTYLFRRLLPASCSGTPSQAPTRSNTFLGPASPACSIIDRKLLLICVKTLGALTQHIRIPPTLLSTGEFLFWELESIREMASCLSQIVTVDNSVMGTEFVTLSKSTGGEDEERQGITPDDELYLQAYLALSNGITLDPKSGPELQAAALQVTILVDKRQCTMLSKNRPIDTRDTFLSSYL